MYYEISGKQESKVMRVWCPTYYQFEAREMPELLRENLAAAQELKTQCYDLKAHEHDFQEGEQLLVLLLTSANKLVA